MQIRVVNIHHDVDNMGMEHAELSFGDSKGLTVNCKRRGGRGLLKEKNVMLLYIFS